MVLDEAPETVGKLESRNREETDARTDNQGRKAR